MAVTIVLGSIEFFFFLTDSSAFTETGVVSHDLRSVVVVAFYYAWYSKNNCLWGW